MGRNTRTRTPHGRRIALSCGTAAGAALIAASISMGNAPAAGADVLGADTVSDFIGAADPAAVSAAGVSDTLATPTDVDPVSDLIGAFDPNAFSTSGAPTDALGLLGYYTDTYLLDTTFTDALGAQLDTYVDSWLSSLPSGAAGVSDTLATPTDVDPVSDLIGAFDPNAFSTSGAPTDALGLLGYYTDTYLLDTTFTDALGAQLDTYVDSWLSSLPSGAAAVLDASPVSDLVGALDPSAFSAGVADLTAPTAVSLLDPVIDGLLNSVSSLF